MSVYEALDDEEMYLAALMDDPSGIDLAEFCFRDETPGKTDPCYRVRDYQWAWYRHSETYQIDQAGRCLQEGTLVLTSRGQIPIELVRVGDLVWTHRGRWRSVTAVFDQGVQDVVRVVGQGHPGLFVTPTHKFWTAAGRRGTVRRDGHRRKVVEDFDFRAVSDFVVGHCTELRSATQWSSPVLPSGPVPDIPAAPYASGRQNTIADAADPDWLWLYGLYVAEGSLSSSNRGELNRVTWSIHPSEVVDVCARLDRLGLRYNTQRSSTSECCVVIVNSQPLAQWLAVNGGKRAHGKHLMPWAFGRREVLEGAIFGDGHTRPNGRMEYKTVSAALAADVRMLGTSLGMVTSWTSVRAHTTVIRGSEVVGGVAHVVSLSLPGAHQQTVVADGHVWSPVSSVMPSGSAQTWDLEVAEDHSFVAEGVVVHNSLGKSEGILMRAHAFPFNFPGQEMLITAPELNHLDPITNKLEEKFLHGARLSRAMLPKQKGGGVKHQPQFQMTFVNGAVTMGRLPNRDGRGVKGSLGAGALVLTRRGQIPIEDVVVGDEVITHEGRWRPVEHVISYFNKDVVTVNGGGHRGLVMSRNHRMLARRALNNPKQVRNLGLPEFLIPGEESDTRFYFGSPTRFEPSVAPAWATPELLWVAGRYVADGFQASRGAQFGIVDDASQATELCQRLAAAGLAQTVTRIRSHNGSFEIRSSGPFAADLLSEFGEHANGKRVPVWLLGAPEALRAAFLDGYLTGDGHWAKEKERWEFGSASKPLTISLLLLAQTLGWSGSYSWVDPKVTAIAGRVLKAPVQRSHRGTLTRSGYGIIEQHVKWQRVRSVKPAVPQMVYDLVVKDDHSYIADGLVSHNQHPLVLEADEMQDYPRQGWIELIETMKAGVPGAQWRCHGVSRGVRDMYYRMTSDQADIPFYVHRFMAMHRPTWSPQERKEKIAIYGGSRDNPDYKRNIYGEHGDVTNPVFVLARLMACVRQHESTWATEYNENIYNLIKVEGESLENRPIESFLTFPKNHTSSGYSSFWAGMDIGFTNDPSELLVFGQTSATRGGEKVDILRLLSRIHLMRISAPDQEKVIEAVFAFYGDRLRALSMDKTGAGIGIWQHMGVSPIRQRVKGYGFSEKRAVEFDDRELTAKETPLDAMIQKNVIEYATGKLREYVDAGWLELPYDAELLTEFQGQTVLYTRDEGSANGSKTRYGGGSFHTLDAAKLMVLGKELEAIEEMQRRGRKFEPVLDAIGW